MLGVGWADAEIDNYQRALVPWMELRGRNLLDPAVQRHILQLLEIPEAEQRRRFGFLLDGLAAGAPPHGGFALGVDRIAMLLAGAPSLRDVIAFPKTTAARALFEGAPSPVDPRDLAALHLAMTDDAS